MMLPDRELGRIAERLSMDFDGQVPFEIVVRVLHEYLDAHTTSTSDQVELAVRIRLQVRRQGNLHDLV